MPIDSTLNDQLANTLAQIRPECDFTQSADFIADGLLDSLDVVTLVSALDSGFGISIKGTEILPENFRSLDSIAALLQRYGVAA